MLAHTTTAGIHRIERLPNATNEDCLKTLHQALTTVALPDLNRVTNVISHELAREESVASGSDVYLWVIYFNGVHAPDAVRDKCDAMYKNVREQVESVGKRTGFSMATLEGRWTAEP